jgi:protein-disulfide isomerase
MNVKLLIAGMLLAPLLVAAADSPGGVCPATDSAVLEINGTKLTLADLEHQNASLLFQARNSYYDAERKAIDGFIDDYLLEQQAKSESLTVAQLLDKHVTGTIAKDPSDEALRVYYEGLDTPQPFEAVRGQIVEALHQRRIARAKAAYIQTLHSKAEIAVLLTAPRADISLQNADYRGPQTALVTVVEYADYECPYCQQAQAALDKLEASYKGKLALVFKDMPLPMHAHAQKAAEASRCAEAQGKYWEYHDLLFTNKQLDISGLKDAARQLKLDEAAFDKCLASGATVPMIKASSEEAQALGVQGTPTLFINGRFYSGALSYEKLQAAIEEELHKTSTTSAQIAQR